MRAIYPSLANKCALVTGGGTGIGASLVEAYAAQGVKVIFCDIAVDEGKALERRLAPSSEFAPVFLNCDLTDIAAVNRMVADAENAFGGLDIVVNNAANDDRHRLDEVSLAYWDERMAVNLRHKFFVAQAALPALRKAGGGVILNFGSISWHLGLTDLVLYQTAKAAIEGMTRSMARDLGQDNIRVNTIIPGNVQTLRQAKWYTPDAEREILAAQCLKKRIQPFDVAALTLFLSSDDARMCTGHDYFVDAGWR